MNRGSGAGLGSTGPAAAARAAFDQFRQLAQFGLGDLELQFVQLFVQRADFAAVGDAEGLEIQLQALHFSRPLVERGRERGGPHAQGLEVVVAPDRGAVECGHVRNDIGWRCELTRCRAVSVPLRVCGLSCGIVFRSDRTAGQM